METTIVWCNFKKAKNLLHLAIL